MSRPMKYSGVEWIGAIPEHWEVRKLKKILKTPLQYGANESGEIFNEDEPRYIRITDITSDNKLKTTGKLSLPISIAEPYLLKDNDILFARSGGTVGKSFLYKSEYGKSAFAGYLIKASILDTIITEYIFYYTLSYSYQKWKEQIFIKSTIQNIGADRYSNLQIPLPTDIKEQQKIVTFLDEKMFQIDSIIEDTKQSIVEFKKYKQALITETVTKGLNPDVKMKDSGIEWIGEIPEHWDAWKLKKLFEIKKVIAGRLGYDILSITQNGLKIKDISNNAGQISADYSKYQFVDIGDFAMNHMDLLTGWIDCATFSGVTSPDYRVFKSRNLQIADNNYYKYVFQVCYSNEVFYGLGQGVSNLGRWRLPTSNFLNFVIPHSPIDEQQQIAEFLDKKTAHMDALIADKESMIQELEEYKKVLIYEYVTGKKEV